MFEGSKVIHSYSRAEAMADGLLVDVSKVAKEAGFRISVALTRAVMVDCVLWPESVAARKPGIGQDESGRLWDVLQMALHSASRARDSQQVTFPLLRVPAEGKGIRPVEVFLVMTIGGGDLGEPVITIMQQGEN